jgi:sec-independent protein translocase protein TatB
MGTPPPVYLDTISMPDTLILMVLALVVFGPRRLPLIGRQIGKLMYEFRKASNDFKFQMEEELRQSEEADRRKKEEEERQRALAAAPPPAQLAPPAESPAQPEAAAEPAPPPEPPADIAADAPEPAIAIPSESTPDAAGANPATPEPASALTAETTVETTIASPPLESKPLTPDGPSTADESTRPRIQPPSTGEKVAAEPPSKQARQGDLFAAESGKEPESVAPETERSEPATHHG